LAAVHAAAGPFAFRKLTNQYTAPTSTARAVADHVLAAQVHQHHRGYGANEVAEVGDPPVAEQEGSADLAGGPGRHDQVVAGEQLGPAHDDQDQAEREYQPGQQPNEPVRQGTTGAGGDGSGKKVPKSDERPREQGQDEQAHWVHGRFLRTDLFGLGGRLGREGGGAARCIVVRH
jgi:hypothetical protein